MRAFRFAVVFLYVASGIAVAQKPRDLSKLDPCKILTPADVAAATKGKVSKTVGGGAGATSCLWAVDAPTGAGTYQLNFLDPSLIEAMFKLKTPAERGTPMPGLWSEASMVPPGNHGDQYILTILKRATWRSRCTASTRTWSRR